MHNTPMRTRRMITRITQATAPVAAHTPNQALHPDEQISHSPTATCSKSSPTTPPPAYPEPDRRLTGSQTSLSNR